jgi:hypothetical protein
VQKKKSIFLKLVLALFALALVVQSFLWTRFGDTLVYDGADEFDSSHNVDVYWDDELDREVKISWSRRDIPEAFIMRAASWEALDRDDREEIFVTSAREACAA